MAGAKWMLNSAGPSWAFFEGGLCAEVDGDISLFCATKNIVKSIVFVPYEINMREDCWCSKMTKGIFELYLAQFVSELQNTSM